MSLEADRHTSVETAISEVLAAERDAVAQIAACESRADEILRDVRKSVRALVRRTQTRVSRLHAECAARTRELVAELEKEAAANMERSVLDGEAQERLAEAVSSVARELTEPDASDAG